MHPNLSATSDPTHFIARVSCADLRRELGMTVRAPDLTPRPYVMQVREGSITAQLMPQRRMMTEAEAVRANRELRYGVGTRSTYVRAI